MQTYHKHFFKAWITWPNGTEPTIKQIELFHSFLFYKAKHSKNKKRILTRSLKRTTWLSATDSLCWLCKTKPWYNSYKTTTTSSHQQYTIQTLHKLLALNWQEGKKQNTCKEILWDKPPKPFSQNRQLSFDSIEFLYTTNEQNKHLLTCKIKNMRLKQTSWRRSLRLATSLAVASSEACPGGLGGLGGPSEETGDAPPMGAVLWAEALSSDRRLSEGGEPLAPLVFREESMPRGWGRIACIAWRLWSSRSRSACDTHPRSLGCGNWEERGSVREEIGQEKRGIATAFIAIKESVMRLEVRISFSATTHEIEITSHSRMKLISPNKTTNNLHLPCDKIIYGIKAGLPATTAL